MNRDLTGWVVRSRVWVMYISVWSGTSHCAMVAAMRPTLGLCVDGKACSASRLWPKCSPSLDFIEVGGVVF